jgi:hypothetical protein
MDKTEKNTAKVDNKVEKDTAKVAKSSAIVSWRGNTREYTVKIHGDKFMDFAKEFAGKVGGSVK